MEGNILVSCYISETRCYKFLVILDGETSSLLQLSEFSVIVRMNALSLCFDEEMQELIFVIRGILSGEIKIKQLSFLPANTAAE